MADPQPQDTGAQPSPDIGAIVGGDRNAVSDLIGVQRAKTAADESIISGAERQQAADARRVEAAYKAEGIGHDELKPWDAEKEHRKFEHDPIEGFGSVGGLFAMVASAFTKAPMENAINGMAGAINSIKAGDEAAYERAHQSWKDNTKLVLDRHKAQHELYQDALGLMSTNQQIAQIKLNHAAVKFGDQKMLALAADGMIKEMFELQEARARSATIMRETLDSITKSTLQQKSFDALSMEIPEGLPPNLAAAYKLAAWNKTHGVKETSESPEQAVAGRIIAENPHATGSELAKKFEEAGIKVGRQPERDKIIQERVYFEEQAIRDREGREPTAAESAKIRQDASLMGRGAAGTGSSTSSQARKTAAIKEIHEKHIADGKPISLAEAEREYNRTVAVPSGNRQEDDKIIVDQIDTALALVDEQKEALKKYSFITGVPGAAGRVAEKVGNITGLSSNTDRQAFESRVEKLKLNASRLLTMTRGRPLAVEAARLDSIVKGKGFGDVNKGTMRAMEDYEKLLIKIKNDMQGHIDDAPPKAEVPKEKTGKDAPWLKDPVKGGEKRSDVEPEVQVG